MFFANAECKINRMKMGEKIRTKETDFTDNDVDGLKWVV